MVRFAFAAVLVAMTFLLPARAATCTSGATQWRTTGCCSCNAGRQQTLWSCNNGTWVNTGYSQCNVGSSCCAFPCCF
ncbi:MAG: hypothetical protein ACJ75H_12635 [Thermoanaerobaculia bacterium]